MLYTKKYNKWLLWVGISLATVGAVAQDEVPCLEQGKQQFNAKNYDAARKTFATCLEKNPQNAEVALSLAGVYLTKEDFKNAEKYFQTALSNMGRTSPYLSYTYSMLGDLALKQGQYKQSLKAYENSLHINAANVNSLVGKAVILQHQGDKLGATDFYRAALAVEPLNAIARKRLIALEPDYLTDEEMLDALKQRYAVLPDKTTLSEDDRKLFSSIHSSELRRGVEYLHNKYQQIPPEYVVALFKDTPFEREVLTLAGYQALQKQIGQDAVVVFQKVGVPLKDVFDLRDRKGKKIFQEDSTLTRRGFYAYTEALQGRKAFLLAREPVPPSQKDLDRLASLLQQLEQAGYVEISSAEFHMLQTKTECSDDTLRKQLGLYWVNASARDRRYFVYAVPTGDEKQSLAFHYVMASRAKRNPNLKIPQNSLASQADYYGYSVCLSDGTLLE